MFYAFVFLYVFWLFMLLITGLYQLFLCVQLIDFFTRINKDIVFFPVQTRGLVSKETVVLRW